MTRHRYVVIAETGLSLFEDMPDGDDVNAVIRAAWALHKETGNHFHVHDRQESKTVWMTRNVR
jgi:hypothetical protein